MPKRIKRVLRSKLHKPSLQANGETKVYVTVVPESIFVRRYPFFASHKKSHTRFGDASAGTVVHSFLLSS